MTDVPRVFPVDSLIPVEELYLKELIRLKIRNLVNSHGYELEIYNSRSTNNIVNEVQKSIEELGFVVSIDDIEEAYAELFEEGNSLGADDLEYSQEA